jgi:outer membrane protein
MNRWKTAPLFLAVLFFMPIFSTHLNAQEVKIGYVFSDEIREKVGFFQQNQKRFEEEALRLQDDLRNLDQEIKQLQTELETQSVWISDDRKTELQTQIQEKVSERDIMARDIYRPQGRIDQLRQQLTGPVVARMLEIIKQIGSDESYTMIIDLSPGVVLYYEGLANLTQRVIDDLNSAFAAETTETTP